MSRTSSSEQEEAHGREAWLGQPPECDDPCIVAPRCAGVAEVMLRSHKLLFQAVKRRGSDEKMIRADSPLLDTARILFLLHVHSTLATSVDYGMDPIE